MTKKSKSAEAESVAVRPKYDSSRVTNVILSRPGHGIPCDQDGCDRDAVWVMQRRDPYTVSSSVFQVQPYQPDPNAPRHVRCEHHLNYMDGVS